MAPMPPFLTAPRPTAVAAADTRACGAFTLLPTLTEEGHRAGIEIRALEDEPLGAEIVGLDLMNKPITPQLVAVVRKALLTYKVLVFRNQAELSPEKQIEFSRHFGVLYQHAIGEFRLPEHEEIVVVSNEVKDGKMIGLNGIENGKSKNGKRHNWHSDLSYMPAPPMGSMLHMKVLPADGSGDTLFADMVGAFEALDKETQAALMQMESMHTFSKNAAMEAIKAVSPELHMILSSLPPVKHPVIRTHPETGRKTLFVSEGFTTEIVGMEKEESEALLQRLYDHSTQDKFVYRHRWQANDCVMWDNRCLLHLATGSDLPRTLYRTTIKGDVVF